jgi:hypothetical protein
LPHHLYATGAGWLIGTVVLVGVSLVVFGGGMHGAAVAVTVIDDAVVRWLGTRHIPGLTGAWHVLAGLGSWRMITPLLWGLLAALLLLRRFRQLVIVLVSWILQGFLVQYVIGSLAARPRPFGPAPPGSSQ